MRIKTNIIELKNLKTTPCREYLKLFEDGKIDAHKAFKEFGEKYEWLYSYSNYDLIGWQIENNCFNWKKHSWAVAMCSPEYFDPELYNWRDFSHYVILHCRQHFNPSKFNWEKDSHYYYI